MNNLTLTDLKQEFRDNEACLEWIKNKLYPGGIRCPVCKKITRHHRVSKRPVYSCNICRHQVSLTSGTVFYKSRVPLKIWFEVMKMFIEAGGSLSAKEVQRNFRLTYKTAWRMLDTIKELYQKNTFKIFLKSSKSEVSLTRREFLTKPDQGLAADQDTPGPAIGQSDTVQNSAGIKQDRTVRLLKLQMLLCQHHQGLNIDELAFKCNVSKRTIYRDLNDLETKLDVPIWQEHSKRGITEGYFLPPVNFNLEEAVDILLSIRTMQSFNYMYIPSMASTYMKLNTIVPMPLKKQISNTISYMEKLPYYEIKVSNFKKIINAWFSGHKVRLSYQFPTEMSPVQHIVEPYFIEPSLSNIGGSSYLIGYCTIKKQVYTFKVNQILGDVMIDPETYKIPDDFNIIDYLNQGFGINSSNNRIEPVKLLIKPVLVEFFRENKLHSSQTFELQNDGSAILNLKVRDTIYFRNLILAWGDQIEVLEPDCIRNQINELARSLVNIYSE